MSALTNSPILALRCKDCGKTFFAHALAAPIDEESAKMIADCVRNGDVPYICESTTFGCMCDKSYLDEGDDEED